MIKNSLKLEGVTIFNNSTYPRECLSDNTEIQVIDSRPFPKILIQDLGLFWQISQDRFSKSITREYTYDYKSKMGHYSIAFPKEGFFTFQKFVNINDEMVSLQNNMAELGFVPLFKSKCNLIKPAKVQDIEVKVIEKNDKTCHLLVNNSLYQLNDQFDFKINKFTNVITWFNETEEKAYSILFQQLEPLINLERIILQIFNRGLVRVTQVQKKSEGEYFSQINTEDLYQRLFFDVPKFAGNVMKDYQQKMDIESLGAGPKVSEMIKGRSHTLTGSVIVSYEFSYLILIKNKTFSIYRASQNQLVRYNQDFVIDHPKRKQLTPKDVFFTKDERNIVFCEPNSNIVYAYNIENAKLLEDLQLPTKDSVIQLNTNDKVKFYAITEASEYELEFRQDKLYLIHEREFNKAWKLRSLAATEKGSIAIADAHGRIRLYATFQTKRSMNNLMIVQKEILYLSFSHDHTIVIVTTKTRIYLFAMEKDPFTKRLNGEEKNGTHLKISQEDREKYGLREFSFKKARLMFNDSYVLATTGSMLILWQVKKILYNLENSYKIINLDEEIHGFEVISEKAMVVNLESGHKTVNLCWVTQ